MSKLAAAVKKFFFDTVLSNGTFTGWDEASERVFVLDQVVLFSDGQQGHLIQYAEDIILDR